MVTSDSRKHVPKLSVWRELRVTVVIQMQLRVLELPWLSQVYPIGIFNYTVIIIIIIIVIIFLTNVVTFVINPPRWSSRV